MTKHEVKFLFKFLKVNGALDAFVDNTIKDSSLTVETKKEIVLSQFKGESDRKALGAISNAFSWSSTKEGRAYWSNLSNKYNMMVLKRNANHEE